MGGGRREREEGRGEGERRRGEGKGRRKGAGSCSENIPVHHPNMCRQRLLGLGVTFLFHSEVEGIGDI